MVYIEVLELPRLCSCLIHGAAWHRKILCSPSNTVLLEQSWQRKLLNVVIKDLKHRRRKRRRRRTAPRKDWVENVVYGGKIRELSAHMLWTTRFLIQRKCEWSECLKRLFTVCPKRSIALWQLCSSRAAPSSFSFFFTSVLFSSANFYCHLYVRDLALIRSLS